MLYRSLGRTGLKVSQLGFGAMRLPVVGSGPTVAVNRELAIPMLHRAFESGVTYVDTAVGYLNQDSQRAVGEALKGWRDRIVVSTKNPAYTTDEAVWWKNLEDSLERLQVQRIDVYHHHGVNAEKFDQFVMPVMSRWMQKAKDQGLIGHIAMSFHDTTEVLKRIIATGYPEVITLQYNLLDRQHAEAIDMAHARGIGIVVMGPVGGGRLGAGDDGPLAQAVPGIRRVPELALRFVLSNPNVSLALSGMSTMTQVEENTRTASDPVALNEADRAAVASHLERMKTMAQLYCTGCGYCLPCPQGVAIPDIFGRYNLGRVYGLWDPARKGYAAIGKNPKVVAKQADACVECGLCEEKCPQKIPIRNQLKEAHKALAMAAG
jgi:predicted aldo/keto reductase-like oxidoreductase